LQLSYLKASVVDIEAITDHAIMGTIYRLANEYGVKYILSGSNVVTEYILPSTWIFNKADDLNIKDIHKHYGKVPLKTYPFFSFKERRYFTNVKGIQTVPLLNYMPYDKVQVKKEITEKLSWRDYGGKHYESIFTRFYQGYILPAKFHIDKRKAHLSTLIFSGQMTKAEAMEELQKPNYDAEQMATDKEFVLKKFGLTESEFDALMALPRKEHTEFNYLKPLSVKYPIIKVLKKLLKKSAADEKA